MSRHQSIDSLTHSPLLSGPYFDADSYGDPRCGRLSLLRRTSWEGCFLIPIIAVEFLAFLNTYFQVLTLTLKDFDWTSLNYSSQRMFWVY